MTSRSLTCFHSVHSDAVSLLLCFKAVKGGKVFWCQKKFPEKKLSQNEAFKKGSRQKAFRKEAFYLNQLPEKLGERNSDLVL